MKSKEKKILCHGDSVSKDYKGETQYCTTQ